MSEQSAQSTNESVNELLEELRQLFADGMGLAINQFGSADKKVDSVSPEIQLLDKEAHALNALVADYATALDTYTPDKAEAADKSFINRRFAAKQLIQLGVISLNQHLAQGVRDIQQQQQKTLSLLGNIDRIKTRHVVEVERLHEAINHGRELLQAADQQREVFGSEQVNRFARRIFSLEQLLASHQMAALQIDNTKSYAQDVLQNAKTFVEVRSKIWRQHVDLTGQGYQPEHLPKLQHQVQHADDQSYVQQKVSRLLWPMLLALSLLYIINSFLSAFAPTHLQGIDQPQAYTQYHSIQYDTYMNAQRELLKQGGDHRTASPAAIALVKQGLTAADTANRSGEFKAPASVRLPMEYFVYGQPQSADLKLRATISHYASLLSGILAVLFCLYKLVQFALSRALYPMISKRRQALLAPLLKVTPKEKKSSGFQLLDDLKSIISDFKQIFK